MVACALAQLALLISGIRLGETLRGKSFKTAPICTESTLSFLTRGLAVLIAAFTITGMSTTHWIGTNTLSGWSGAATFCRQFNITADTCVIPISTTILSVTAAALSLFTIVFAVCGIVNAIRRQAECYALPICLFPTAIILWFTIATTMGLEETGYSFRVIIAAGPFAHLALLIGGIWFSIAGEPSNIISRRF